MQTIGLIGFATFTFAIMMNPIHPGSRHGKSLPRFWRRMDLAWPDMARRKRDIDYAIKF
jgi:hypothetical protein